MDLGNMAGIAVRWGSNILFWILFLTIIIFVLFGFAYLRKRKKYIYPFLELIDIGGGKVAFQMRKAGWFQKKWFLGLWDYGGDEELITDDNRLIQEASSEDFHEINGRRGIVAVRKPDDPKILLPVNRAKLKEKTTGKWIFLKELLLNDKKDDKKDEFGARTGDSMMMEIAPADYRDASNKINQRTNQDMSKKWEQYAPLAINLTLGILLMISILFIIQYAKHSQAEAYQFTKEAMLQSKNVVASTTAPLFMFFRNKKRKEE